MYKLDHNKNFLPRNILDLNKKFENKNNNFKINPIELLANYFKKLKNKLIYDSSRLLKQILYNKFL